MTVRLLYFAWLRERIGCAEEEVSPPEDVDSLGALIAWLRSRGAPYETVLAEENRLRYAVNQDFATAATRFAPGDEIALFPPVTGG